MKTAYVIDRWTDQILTTRRSIRAARKQAQTFNKEANQGHRYYAQSVREYTGSGWLMDDSKSEKR